MNPEHELARKAGLLNELECYEEVYNHSRFYVAILAVLAAALGLFGYVFSIPHSLQFAALIAFVSALFTMMGVVAKYHGVPSVLRRCRKQLKDAEDDGSFKAQLIRTFLGVERKKMFDEGFRPVKRSQNLVKNNRELEVLGRGNYSEDAVATAEEFAVLFNGVTIAMSRVIAIEADSIWGAGQADRFEDGDINGQIFSAIARSRVEAHVPIGEGPPLEIICIGLQSSTEQSDYGHDWTNSLSSARARRLVDTMESKSLVWHGAYNLRIDGLILGKALETRKFGGEPERRQRSAIVIFLTRDMSYDRVLPFSSAIAEIVGVSAINGADLSGYEYSDDLSNKTIKGLIGSVT